MTEVDRRPSPEKFLRQAEMEERHARRGKLKIFLGYASGVGKSFRMLDEGRRRKERGQDVVVAAAQHVVSDDVKELIKRFEVIPARMDLGAPSVDVAAIKKRHPSICLIDGLAYNNPPGSNNEYRWQDVEELLLSGVSVITSINLQYVRERQTQVEAIRGRVVTESVPVSFLLTADEIEIVDAPPEYCVDRAIGKSGAPVAPDEFARQLSELREIALLLAAEVVDHQLEEYLRRNGLDQHYGANERILVCLTPRSNAALMIRRARRQAERFHGELYAVYVEQNDLRDEDRTTLETNLRLSREAHAQVHVLRGEDPVGAIVKFAGEHGVTQIFVGHSQRTRWWNSWRPNPVERLILESEGIDVRIFPNSGGAM